MNIQNKIYIHRYFFLERKLAWRSERHRYNWMNQSRINKLKLAKLPRTAKPRNQSIEDEIFRRFIQVTQSKLDPDSNRSIENYLRNRC